MTNAIPQQMTLRELRDMVFHQKTSDKNWEACKDNWSRPDSIAWLQLKVDKQLTAHNRTN